MSASQESAPDKSVVRRSELIATQDLSPYHHQTKQNQHNKIKRQHNKVSRRHLVAHAEQTPKPFASSFHNVSGCWQCAMLGFCHMSQLPADRCCWVFTVLNVIGKHVVLLILNLNSQNRSSQETVKILCSKFPPKSTYLT